ncbi:MAG: cbb3-type cytochrome c oxidase subunit I [Flavipsychrobacter sp.]
MFIPVIGLAQQIDGTPSEFTLGSSNGLLLLFFLLVLGMFFLVMVLSQKAKQIKVESTRQKSHIDRSKSQSYLKLLTSKQIQKLLQRRKGHSHLLLIAFSVLLSQIPVTSWAQSTDAISKSSLFNEAGVLITIILLMIPITVGVVILIMKLTVVLKQYKNRSNLIEAKELAKYIDSLGDDEIEELQSRKSALDYQLTNKELSGNEQVLDNRGLIKILEEKTIPIVAVKKRAQKPHDIDPELKRLILWFIGTATFWLLFGTTVGEYLGIKFAAPDIDHVSWLSFGRLRPVHTNSVFWGWASLGMIGLAYYIVPKVSNTKLANMKTGWYSLFLINAAVILGTICLMSGINNGGGEYREYTWPVMLLFAIALIITLVNFIQTVAKRTTREIYISNWYIIASIIFTIVISIVAYLPFWQNGLGETIVQGYYMHQGVGMWFMLFTLGIVYYFLPQQLNKPIYSYSLGILAFWTQILFYTLIGTHHFVFSSIPWWLQTVAIVGSAGMAIPVVAGTTNFLLTFKGVWYKIKDSYTLPFFLVGIVFYFTGSMQGTAEAFRSTNLLWHFTDFTVAHSHLTMYGIICFFLWACIYAIVPRLTGREAPQMTIGAHFWLALIGLLFYTVPLMYGSTLKGLLWIEGKPFIDSVILMAPYWLWRAIGGSLMWLSHIVFAYNLYKMIITESSVDVKDTAINLLKVKSATNS